MRRARTYLGLWLAAFSLPAIPARADDLDDLDELLSEDVQSTAGKTKATGSTAPALVHTITAEEIKRHGIRTLAEAYEYLGLGLTPQNPLDEPEVGARGVLFTGDQGNHVLLLLDGHTLNDQQSGASYHEHFAGIPMEMVDHIEVVLGPGSVLYGSNAMLAVVNVVTKRAKDHDGVFVLAEGSVSPPVNRDRELVGPSGAHDYFGDLGKSYRLGLGLGQEFRAFGSQGEVVVRAQHYAEKGPTFSWGPQEFTRVDFGAKAPYGVWVGKTRTSYDIQASSIYARTRLGELTWSLHGVYAVRSSPFDRIFDIAPSDFDDGMTEDEWLYYGFDVAWARSLSKVTSVSLRLYADEAQRRETNSGHTAVGCLDPRTPNGCTRRLRSISRWVGLEAQVNLDWSLDRSVYTLLGVDGRLREVGFGTSIAEFHSEDQVASFGDFSNHEQLAGIYAQQVWRPIDELTLNAGARLDVDSRFGSHVSPRGALVATPWESSAFKVIFSEAFRAPAARELEFTNGTSVLSNPDLKPEVVRSLEGVVEQRIGTHQFTLGAFRSWWTDVVITRTLLDVPGIAPNPDTETLRDAKRRGLITPFTTAVNQSQNVAEVTNYGLNFGYRVTSDDRRLALGANLTLAHAELDTPEGRQDLPVAPNVYGNVHGSYTFGDEGPTLGLAAAFSDARLWDEGENPEQPSPLEAPPALSTRGTLSGPVPGVTGLSYRGSATYAWHKRTPFSAGPFVGASTAAGPNDELAHLNRLTLMLGLELELD